MAPPKGRVVMQRSDGEPKLILMPAIARGGGPGRVVRWFVGEGDEVAAGDVIGEIATIAATFELEADEKGRIAAILVRAGTEDVIAGTPLLALTASATTDEQPPVPRLLEGNDAPAANALDEQQDQSRSLASANHRRTASDTIDRSQSQALREAMAIAMRRDQDVLLIGPGVADAAGSYSPTAGLIEEFGPRRVVDTRLSPAALAGLALGAAMERLKPVVVLGDWSSALAALEPIVNTAAKANAMTGGEIEVPVVFRITDGSAARAGAQHGQCLAAWLAHIPGLKLVTPSSPADAQGLLTAAIRDPGPVVIVEHEALASIPAPVPRCDDHVVEIGRACTVRPGHDVTLVTYGRCVGLAVDAAVALAGEGIGVEVVDLRSLRPLDMDHVLASVRRTGRLVTVEDGWPVGAIGSEIVAGVVNRAFADLLAPPARVTGADLAAAYAANLEALTLPDVARIVATLRSTVHGAASG